MSKIVIIGGVAGGATAATRLRRLNEAAEIVVLEKGSYISYANCGLPYHIGGVIASRSSLILKTEADFASRYRIEVRLNNEATAVNRERKTVSVTDLTSDVSYEEAYDQLIIATGATPTRPEADDDAQELMLSLHSIDDMDRILAHIEATQPASVAVLGGGFVGIEAAENLIARGLAVTLIQRSRQILPALDPEMGLRVQAELRNNGVQLLLESPVAGIHRAGGGLSIELIDGRSLTADFLIAAIGVRPNSRLAAEAGLAIGELGGIRTDDHMRTSDPDIYAVGDCVEVAEFISQTPSLIALAGPANKQARVAANNICGRPTVYKGTLGSQLIKVFGLTAASTGLNEKRARALGLDYDKVYYQSQSHAGYYPGAQEISFKLLFERGSGRILGAQLVGAEGVDKRADVLATAIQAGWTAFDLADLELGYAPPYSSAKDPLNIIGNMVENLLDGLLGQFHWDEIGSLPRDGSANLIDVRTPGEYARGHVEGFVNIPVDELRSRIDEVDPAKPAYLICQLGLRSYTAARILSARGIQVSHLAGGYRLYSSML